MEDNKNLEMGLFDNIDLELNLDLDPQEIIEDIDKPDDTDGVDDSNPDDKNININEDNQDDDPEEVVDKDQDDEGDDDSDDASSSNLYLPLASALNEQGLLPSLNLDETKIESIEDLTNAFKTEIDNQTKNYLINKLGSEGYEALEAGVSLSQYQQHQDDDKVLDTLSDESLEQDLELAKKVILQDYVNQGISEDKALRFLKRSIDLGEEAILEDARQSLESLKVFQGKKLEKIKEENRVKQEQVAAQQEKIDNDLKNSIYNQKEIINGLKLNKSIQDNIYNSITKVVSTDPNTGIAENKLMRDRRENPIDFDTKLYYLYELTNGFADFSKLVTSSKSKATSQLERALRSNKSFDDLGKPGFLNDPDSYGGIGTEVVF